ncbi:Uncharacterized conserved protein, DUF2267 family [Micromonospora phaseoli]|uniref:Uncharacterized conserved protein, DUF2267 family n=1 Tax=Micromonospora phaseoli TaxID=1144548 RepID=A0A1H6YQ94_9ACTN|nr:DUF2267 domain-containing protein [Micromonospora phaseoli]PZW00333.1 uncharacterized protein (DUF2267 family) [Micromonospora phaseoli]GIJ76811.1 hypothetical protein Xph01_12430 [Micromonospora phaseoli]SEJ43488.1 Uncharacterized conserved protein, DUF2267 family [Micromonospora phaseoli]
MNYDTFVDQVARRAGTSWQRAVELTRATLETLAERLTGGEVLDLAVQLPEPLRLPLRPTPDIEAAERFGAAEFVARVAVRAGVQEPAARDAIRAVFITVREAVSGGEFDELVVQMPRDYRDMVEPALAPGATLRRR